MAVIGNQGGNTMWPSLVTASWLYNLANWFLIGALVVGAASTVLIVWMGNVKEGYVNHDLVTMREHAAKAEKEAAGAQLALEKFKAPRSLDESQVESIREGVSGFAGQQFTINTYWNEKEPADFAKRVGDAILLAGWSYIRPTGFLIGVVSGVGIQISADSSERQKDAADALNSSLAKVGVQNKIIYEPTYKDKIAIQIGVKKP
jgi:hypothetical protein